jgi:membrane protease YdiL (CAAX protease family)
MMNHEPGAPAGERDLPRPPVVTSVWRDPLWWFTLLLPFPFWWVAHAQGWQPVASWWMLLLVAPVLEELVFRGALQGMFLRTAFGRMRYRLITVANVGAASLFALLHAFSHGTSLQLLTFFPGLVFGMVRDRYGRVGPAIFLHAYYNLGLFLI